MLIQCVCRRLPENYLRLYWQQMLEAVHTVHEEKIIHSDLKPANFLCVKGEWGCNICAHVTRPGVLACERVRAIRAQNIVSVYRAQNRTLRVLEHTAEHAVAHTDVGVLSWGC